MKKVTTTHKDHRVFFDDVIHRETEWPKSIKNHGMEFHTLLRSIVSIHCDTV